MSNLPRTAYLEQLLRNDPTSYERVPADLAQARLILVRIADEELLAVMLLSRQAYRSGLDSLHRTAHTSAYDAARKGVDAVLLALGVRCSRAAGHVGTVKAAAAVLPPPPESRARNVQAFARARLVRHEDEYPRAPETSTVSLRERRFQTKLLRTAGC